MNNILKKPLNREQLVKLHKFELLCIILFILFTMTSAMAQESSPQKNDPIETYVQIFLVLQNDQNLTEKERDFLLKKSEAIKNTLTIEEHTIAMQTVQFRQQKINKEKREKSPLPKHLQESMKIQKERIWRETQAALSKAKSEKEKILIEQEYNRRLKILESQYR